MDVGALHSLVCDVSFDTFGVDITIRPDDADGIDPIETVGVWMTPQTAGTPNPFGGIRRAEPMKVLAIKSADAQLITREATRIDAPDGPGGTERRWRVDGVVEVFTDHTRFRLIRDLASESE